MKKKYHTPVYSDQGLKAEKYLFACRKKTNLYLLLCLLLIAVPGANIHAEGSGNWKGTQTGRQSSLWVPGNNTGNTGYNTRGSMMRPSAASNYDANHRFFVYVKAGETVFFSFRSSTSSNFTWYYDNTTAGYNTFFPSGISAAGRTAVTAANSNLQGRTNTNTILTQAQAVAGPAAITSGGYTVGTGTNAGGQFTNNTGQDRAFWVEMASPGDTGFEISEWDVTVASGNTKRPGRVYCKYWSTINGLPSGTNGQSNASSFHDNFGFYVPVDNTYSDQPDDYYIKYVNFGGSNAGYAVFFANDSGPLNNELSPGVPDIEGNRKSITGTSNRYQYPLFVEEPDESIWKTSLAPIASTDVRFRRKPDATGGEAYFKVEIDTPGALDILVDLDDSGGYSAGDVQIFRYFDEAGIYEVYWDGKDASGNVVPGGTQIKLLTSANFFPVHFPVFDMEQSLGITMKNMRPVDMASATVKLFWDHSKIYTGDKNSNSWSGTPSNSVQSPAVNTTGVDSPGNIWWGSGDNGIGNNNTFNVYAGSWMETLELNFTFNWDKSDIEVVKTINNPTPAIGSEVTFTIKVTNKGLMYAQDITVDDLLPSGYEYKNHSAPMGATVTPAPIGSNDPETWNNQQTTYDTATGKWTVYDIPYDSEDLSKNVRILTIRAKVLPSGIYNNTAEGYPEVPSSDPDHSNNSSTVVVTPVNTTYAVNDINVTHENQSVTGNVLTNDFDPEGHTQAVTSTGSISTAEGGSVVMNADGTYTYTPKADFTGTDSFTYTVCDDVPAPLKACATATVTINVLPVRDPSGNNNVVANDDTGITEEDTPVSGNVLSNDFDPDGDNLIITTTPVSSPAHGSVTISADGTYTYTPDPGFKGTDTFEYEVCDDGDPKTCDRATVTIIVLPKSNKENHTYANDDIYYAEGKNPVNGNVLDNDYDPEGDDRKVTQVTGPSNGSLTLDDDGTFTYVPEDGFIGTDIFVYEVCDDGDPVACDRATVYILVSPPALKNYWHGTISTEWDNVDNWTAKYVPLPGEDIEFATDDNNGVSGNGNGSGAAVRDLYLEEDRVIGNLINNSDMNLVVTLGDMLTINGTVTDENSSDGTIVVKADPDDEEAGGTLIFTNPGDNQNVEAIVEFYNQAFDCADCGFYTRSWQYFGIPVNSVEFPYGHVGGSEMINQWTEPFNGNKWQLVPSGTALEAFKGYEITNDSKSQPTDVYSFAGTLNVGDAVVPLTRTTGVNYPGANLVSNSYTAAIPISADALTFPTDVNQAVYLFNTGTRDQWRKLNGTAINQDGYRSGQYLAVPVNLGGQDNFPDRVPSMHAFMLLATDGSGNVGNLEIDYSKLVKNTTVNRGDGTQIVTRSAKIEESQNKGSVSPKLPSLVMDVIGEQSADRVWIFSKEGTSHGYDNGWDGRKMTEDGIVQLYVEGSDDSQLQVATVSGLDNVTIGFEAESDGKYTLDFFLSNELKSAEIYLHDLVTGAKERVVDGSSYTFEAKKGASATRFRLTYAGNDSLLSDDEALIEVSATTDGKILISNQSGRSCTAFISDENGTFLQRREVNAGGEEVADGLAGGVYVIRLQNTAVNDVRRVVIE
jgi:conserved repeat domain